MIPGRHRAFLPSRLVCIFFQNPETPSPCTRCGPQGLLLLRFSTIPLSITTLLLIQNIGPRGHLSQKHTPGEDQHTARTTLPQLKMDLPAFPPQLDFGSTTSNVRLAKRDDLGMLDALESSGSWKSRLFQSICPYMRTFPDYTSDFLRRVNEINLKDPRTVVIVVDEVKPPSGTPSPSDHGAPRQDSQSDNRVVAMAVWRLPENSTRLGHFVVDIDARNGSAQELEDRDADPVRNRISSALMHAGCEK